MERLPAAEHVGQLILGAEAERPSVAPLRPEELTAAKAEQLPDVVLATFNQMIIEKGSLGRAVIDQDEVVKRLVAAGLSRNEIYDRHYLDVEEVYRAAGWKVTYDSPGYNETGRSYFTFNAPK